MTVVAAVAYVLLGGGALLALLRLARGPSLLDRVVATDTLLVIIASGLAVYAGLEREPTLVPVLVVVSLLAFVGSVSIARYVGGMLLRSPDEDGQEAGLPPAAETAAAERAGIRRAARTAAAASEAARHRPAERGDGA
jgi:multicomponent Na+:H+ antiporter subunit F